MVAINQLVSLIGKSELDSEIKAVLASLEIAQPLRRPRRGDDQVNVEIDDEPFELCFVKAESLFPDEKTFREGELVLSTVFLHLSAEDVNKRLAIALPFGLSSELSRSELRKKLGDPAWSSPVLNNDRWVLNGFRVLVCFSDDESRIDQIAISINP